jgi:PQQ-like domain
MKSIRAVLVLFWPYLILTLPVGGADVFTYHNDNQRTGLNPDEVGLIASTVPQLSQKWFFLVDGEVYAQPLYVSSVAVADGTRHNMLIVATELDSVYALDAETGAQLWKASLIPGGERQADSTTAGKNCGDLTPWNGVTATPVVDRDKGKIFVVAYTQNLSTGHHIYRLHSVDLATGNDTSSPEITATFPGSFPAKDVSGGQVQWRANEVRNRAALLLAGNTIYTAWASFCDFAPYAGWIIAFDESSLTQVGRIDVNPTKAGLVSGSSLPDGSGAGIWGAGGALAAAPTSTFVFACTGNGPFDGRATFGDSILKLTLNSTQKTVQVLDFFTPFDQATDQQRDRDLGSGGVVILPTMTDAGGTARKLGVVCGKDSKIYVFDRTNLGKFNSANNSNLYQVVSPTAFASALVFGPPAYFNGALYYGPKGRQLMKFVFSQARLGSAPTAMTSTSFGVQGTVPSISAFINGSGVPTNGIVWAIQMGSQVAAPVPVGGIHQPVTPTTAATLHAYDAVNLTELYNSSSNSSLDIGVKFTVPTICNSMVYLGTKGTVYAFGGDTTGSTAVDVTKTPGVKITLGPYSYHSSTGHFVQTVTVTNIGSTPLFKTPLSFVLDGLSSFASLVKNSGSTILLPNRASAYQNFSLTSPLAPGASVSVGLTFIDPKEQASGNATFTYTPRLLDGLGYR